MLRYLRPVWAEIDLDKLKNNMREIRRISKSKEVIAVVKGNAYGHGAIDIAPILLKNGASSLAVAVLSEALELRKAKIDCPIMILGYTSPSLGDILIDNNIEQTIYSYKDAYELSKLARIKNKTLNIHIALDTGMGRLGFLPKDDSIEEICKINQLPNINIKAIFSHFSDADESDKEYTLFQIKRFKWFIDKLKERNIEIPLKHVANSASIIDLEDIHLDGVRPGIIIYGYYPSHYVLEEKLKLEPVMSLKTNIVHIKTLPKGEYIGYGRTFITKRESVIATLPVGYGDGYNRLLSNKGKVIINNQFAPIVGRICMDQCMVDVTDIKDAKIGDPVTIMGSSNDLSYTAEDIAKEIGTISYEVVCNISKRVPRVYVEKGNIANIRNYS